ncbi:MAG: nicotinate (nicotinamide) nucleotide adenylyltransferase [Acidobacteriaceae bacterium]
MKIGFYGGSFDPPHRGHIALARLAMQRIGLGRVLFAPVGVQPLKRDRPQADFADRVAMTELAIANELQMEVSTLDAPHADGSPNYTIDTITALRASRGWADRVFCLMGADSFLSIGRWHRSVDLLRLCSLVVAARPGFLLDEIESALPEGVSAGPCDPPMPADRLLCLFAGGRLVTRVHLLPDLAENVSASDIRAALQTGADESAVLNPRVAAYIREHGLYRQAPDAPDAVPA